MRIRLKETILYTMNKAVAKAIRDLRKKRGISQEKLADMIDSHQVYISEIERGLKMPSLPVLYAMAKCFGVSLSESVAIIERNMENEDK